MNETQKYLLDKEWSMGNGQCLECSGLRVGYWSNFKIWTSVDEGHQCNCRFAAVMKEAGLTPIFKEIVYE